MKFGRVLASRIWPHFTSAVHLFTSPRQSIINSLKCLNSAISHSSSRSDLKVSPPLHPVVTQCR